MSIAIQDDTTPQMIREAKQAGAWAGKGYGKGATTNAKHGLSNFFTPEITETFAEMERLGMLLLLHGEQVEPGVLVTKREEAFLPILWYLAHRFPNLKIVLEHVSTRAGVEMVRRLWKMGFKVGATITVHHLLMTLDDVIGEVIRPHHMCKPVPKDYDDREALLEAATGEEEEFWCGSDSAPHPRKRKESAEGPCGLYTAPVLMPLLLHIFLLRNRLHNFESFVSVRGPQFYGLSVPDTRIKLVNQPWRVPDYYGDEEPVVPLYAGQTLDWRLVS